MTTSIVSSIVGCLKSFNEFIETIKDPSPQKPAGLSIGGWEDELGRLRIWAANIGAHQTNQSSLDFRLRDASHIRDQILKLLQDLIARLEDARDISAEAANSDSDKEIASDEESDDEDSLTEMQELQKTIASIIKSLFLMSMLVRKPAQHDLRIGSSRSEVVAFQPFDYSHVRDKYPRASEALISRLGSAITRRRMYLKYRERHAAKLKQGIANVVSDATGLQNDGTANVTVLSDTVATSAQDWNIDFDDRASNSGVSQTSYAATLMSGDAITIPPPPKASRNGDPFECPICYHIIKIESTRSWNKRVFLDLQPYLCLSDDCTTPQKLYATRHEWLHHLQTSHPKPKSTESSDKQDIECPLCPARFSDDVHLGRHSARHLQDLALFALPSSLHDIEEDSDADRSVLASENETDSSDEGDLLADTYRDQGRWKVAEELQVGELETTKRVLGEEHPFTLTSMANLASTYANQGRWKEAEELEVGVMKTRERVLGEEHPSTLTSMANLASTYANQGRWKEAEELEVGVMKTRERVLGEEHPSTLTSMANLASTPDEPDVTNFTHTDSHTGIGLLDVDNSCLKCGIYVERKDSIDCATCADTYHRKCVQPPIPQYTTRDFSWYCEPCRMKWEPDYEDRDARKWQKDQKVWMRGPAGTFNYLIFIKSWQYDEARGGWDYKLRDENGIEYQSWVKETDTKKV